MFDINSIDYTVLILKINTLHKNYRHELRLDQYIRDIYIEYQLQDGFLDKVDKIVEIITKIDDKLNFYNKNHTEISDYIPTILSTNQQLYLV
jgi:hypothetical protein